MSSPKNTSRRKMIRIASLIMMFKWRYKLRTWPSIMELPKNRDQRHRAKETVVVRNLSQNETTLMKQSNSVAGVTWKIPIASVSAKTITRSTSSAKANVSGTTLSVLDLISRWSSNTPTITSFCAQCVISNLSTNMKSRNAITTPRYPARKKRCSSFIFPVATSTRPRVIKSNNIENF